MADFKFLKLKRGAKKVPQNIIKNKRQGAGKAAWRKHGTWEEADSTFGDDALSQALNDTGWDPRAEDPSLWG